MSAAAAKGVAAEELHGTLQVLASRLLADGQPLQAIKCYVAMLGQSMLPSDEAATRLTLGQMLMQHTLNAQDAKQQLQKAVSVFLHKALGADMVIVPCTAASVMLNTRWCCCRRCW